MLVDVGLTYRLTNQAHPTQVRGDGDGYVVRTKARSAALRVARRTNALQVVEVKIYATTTDVLDTDETRTGISVVFGPASGTACDEAAELGGTLLGPARR